MGKKNLGDRRRVSMYRAKKGFPSYCPRHPEAPLLPPYSTPGRIESTNFIGHGPRSTFLTATSFQSYSVTYSQRWLTRGLVVLKLQVFTASTTVEAIFVMWCTPTLEIYFTLADPAFGNIYEMLKVTQLFLCATQSPVSSTMFNMIQQTDPI